MPPTLITWRPRGRFAWTEGKATQDKKTLQKTKAKIIAKWSKWLSQMSSKFTNILKK